MCRVAQNMDAADLYFHLVVLIDKAYELMHMDDLGLDHHLYTFCQSKVD